MRLRTALVLTVLVAACLSFLPPLPASATDVVVVLGGRAEPATVTVTVGDAVTFRNEHDDRHRLRAREPEDVDTSDIEPGASASVTFPVPGRYVLVDERSDDPAYTVTVEVREVAGPAPSPGASSSPPPRPTTGSATAPPSTATVSIPDDVFSPASVTIATGGTVTWDNRDGNHTVTADDRSFDSGVFDSGRFEHTFPRAGTFGYRCLLHPEMRGTVEVVGSGRDPAPTADGPTASPDAPTKTASPTPPAATAATPASSGAAVAVRDFDFGPASLQVRVGSTVTWTNRGQALHNVVSTDGGPLRSGFLETGGTYRARLDRTGTFAYRCELHPGMTGRVVVTGPSGGDGSSASTGSSLPAPPASPDGSSSPSAAPSPASDGSGRAHALDIVDLAFAPRTLTVGVGDTLVWENREEAPHTVTSTGDGPFRSGMLRRGDRYEVVVTEPGTYPYLCAVHPEMTGEVVVTADVAASAEPPAGGSATPSRTRPAGSSSNGDLAPIAAIMLFFMLVTFVVGRTTARP